MTSYRQSLKHKLSTRSINSCLIHFDQVKESDLDLIEALALSLEKPICSQASFSIKKSPDKDCDYKMLLDSSGQAIHLFLRDEHGIWVMKNHILSQVEGHPAKIYL